MELYVFYQMSTPDINDKYNDSDENDDTDDDNDKNDSDDDIGEQQRR